MTICFEAHLSKGAAVSKDKEIGWQGSLRHEAKQKPHPNQTGDIGEGARPSPPCGKMPISAYGRLYMFI
ncbi:MAG: hypothetical protein A3B62_03420 [Rhodospirillales bacterium RIFCSPLOWO2_01_FULL_65_14]|nr:MAG: hypothetical protein A3B62_03420 [Rhodospirillales bacterium RIFCSPLOWO2_01_FULL_65_14]